jgi:hypothetical protein
MIIAKIKTANIADIYIFTFANSISKLCPSSKDITAININNGGSTAPIKLNKNILDLLSFKNSILIK